MIHGPESRSPTRNRRPSGSPPGHKRRAIVSLTIATGAPSGPSAGAKSRPRRSGMPRVSKYPGATTRRSTSGALSRSTAWPSAATRFAEFGPRNGALLTSEARATPGSAARVRGRRRRTPVTDARSRSVPAGGEGHRRHTGGREPGVDRLQAEQAAHEEERAGGDDHRQRDLEPDDGAAQASPGRADGAAPLAQRARHGLDARGLERGHEAEERGRGHGGEGGEGHHSGIDADIVEAWQRRGSGRAQARRHPCRQQQSEGPARRRQEPALRQHLRGEPPPARAQGGADGHLALAAGGAAQHQVGDVRARDHQDQRDHAEQQQQRLPQLGADDGVAQRAHRHRPSAVGLGAERLEP